MNKDVVGAAIGTSVSATGTAMQPNQILSTISLVLTIIGSLITIGMAIAAWWKKARKDGKIDKEEVDELIDIVGDGVKELKDKTQNKEEEK